MNETNVLLNNTEFLRLYGVSGRRTEFVYGAPVERYI